jgi:ribosomal protein L7/L12
MSGDVTPQGRYTPAGMRKHLVGMYPATFKPKGQIKLPLKIGIHFDIQAREPWLTMDEIKAGLKDYTDGPKYLEQCVQGAWRVDLDGRNVSMVTARQQQHSAARLARLRAEWSGEGKTLGDILNEALELQGKAPVISTTTSPAPGVLDARSTVDTIMNTSSLRAAEYLVSRDQQLIKFGESQSADLSRMRAAFDTAMKDVVRHLREGRKIEAIKAYRIAAGVGLKEAKDFVESMQGLPGVAVTPVHTPFGQRPLDFLVLTKSPGYSNYEEESRFSEQYRAEDSAQRASAAHPRDEVLLVKIIGRTKSVFSMVA